MYGLAKTMLFVLHGQSWSEGLDPDRPLLELVETTPAVRKYYGERRRTTHRPNQHRGKVL